LCAPIRFLYVHTGARNGFHRFRFGLVVLDLVIDFRELVCLATNVYNWTIYRTKLWRSAD
jgi:hypothetical protein